MHTLVWCWAWDSSNTLASFLGSLCVGTRLLIPQIAAIVHFQIHGLYNTTDHDCLLMSYMLTMLRSIYYNHSCYKGNNQNESPQLHHVTHYLSYFFMIIIIACVLKVPISHEYIHMYKYCPEFDLACT